MGVPPDMTEFDENDEHPLAETLRRHYERHVAPDVAARHVMAIHREAARMRLAERRALRGARRPRRAVVASLAGAMLLGSSTGALAASDDAVPGDLLYPVKRASETARLLAAMPFSAQGTVHLDLAAERAEEATALAGERPDVVLELAEQADAALAAARREGAPNVDELATAISTAVSQALVAARPGTDPGPAAAAVPQASPSATVSNPPAAPSQAASPVVSETPSLPGAPETTTVVTPTPQPTPTPTPIPAPIPAPETGPDISS